MKKILLIVNLFFVLLLCGDFVFGQACSATWNLNTSITPATGGAVTASTVGTGAPAFGSGVTSQGTLDANYGSNGQSWPTSITTPVPSTSTFYIQFSVTPTGGTSLNISSINLNDYNNEPTPNDRLAVFWSTSSSFATSTAIVTGYSVPAGLVNYTNGALSGVSCASGQTLYFRVYLYYATSSTVRHGIKSMVLSGTTTPPPTSPATYTSDNFFTVPAGVTSLTVYNFGGGGAGAGASSEPNMFTNGGGGGGGACAYTTFAVTPGDIYTITVGAGGIGGTGAGGNGGTTTFSGPAGTWTAGGGTGAPAPSTTTGATNAGGAGSSVGTGTGVTVLTGGTGSGGYNGTSSSTGIAAVGGGGAGSTGNGTSPAMTCASTGTGGTGTYPGGNGGINAQRCTASANSAGVAGSIPSGGGSGNMSWSTNQSGGNGAGGQTVVVWSTCSAPTITLGANAPGAANQCAGTTKVSLQSFSLAISASTCDGNLTNVGFTTTGTYVQADITKYQLWWNSSNNLGTAAQLGVDLASSGGAGTRSFAAFTSPTLTSGSTYYFWITADIAAGATNNNTIACNATATGDLTSTSTKAGSSAAGGTQTLKATPSSNAGSNQSNCNSGNFTLAGNNPAPGTGLWTCSSGCGGVGITTPSSNTSGVTGVAIGTPATLVWTVSNAPCTAATSNVTLTNNANNAVGVSIAAVPSGAICSGTNVVFTATPTNGGAGPSYNFKVNGISVQSGASATYSSSTLVNGDAVTCVLTSNVTCPTGNPATSNSIAMTVNPLPTIVTVSGGGTFCNNATLTAANGGSGTIYWQNTTSGGTSTATPSNSQVVNSTGTYYFRAQSAAACWGTEGSAAVTINVTPSAPVSTAGTAIAATSFSANWNASAGATGYYLDVCTDAGFTTFVSGYNNLDVFNVLTYSVTGLTPGTNYWYRVRAYNTCGTSSSSGSQSVTTSSYCTPSGSTLNTTYVSNFTTTAGITNINNTSTYSASGYGNFTAQSCSQYANTSINFSASFVGTTVGFAIWVDWNSNGVFTDAGERVYNTAAYVSSASGSFTVPVSQTIGSYRMRIIADYNATSPTSCVAATSGRGEAEDYTFTVIAAPPSAPAFSNTPANSALQTTFNNLTYNSTTPIFSLSATSSTAFNRYQIELNTNETFTGTSYTQTFSGTYSSATKYDLTCSSLSPSLPNTNTVYFCRARASADGGTNWGSWSSSQWCYVYSTGPFGWHITSKPQFNLGTLLYNNYGNFLVPNDNGTPTTDYIDDWLELQQGSSDNSLTTAGDQYLDEAGNYYSGASNNCITVGYYANGFNYQDYHGFRIQSADIPQGATILSASFTPYAHSGSGCGGSANTTNQLIMRIRGVNQDNCNAWAGSTNTSTGSPQWRVRTTAYDDWNVPSGASQQWSTGLLITTAPDITNVVQEIVNRAGYAAGNALGLIVDHNSGAGNYWRYFATMTANVSYSARLQTTFTNFTNDIQYPSVALANYTGATSWNSLIFDVDKSACGACDATFYVYDASGPTLIASGNTSPISLGSNTAANVYVKVRLKRNSSPIFKSMTLTATNGPLPVEMVDFSATCKDNKVQLNWSTASEQNNDYFEVERSRDEVNFQTIVRVNGAGNSSTTKKYSATDNDVYGANYYRLKQVDYNGNSTYSKVIFVPCRTKGLDVTAIVPVPSDNYVDIYYNIDKDDEVVFTAYDGIGNRVIFESEKAKEGGNIHRMYLTDLSSGIYHLVIRSSSDVYSSKIVKK